MAQSLLKTASDCDFAPSRSIVNSSINQLKVSRLGVTCTCMPVGDGGDDASVELLLSYNVATYVYA